LTSPAKVSNSTAVNTCTIVIEMLHVLVTNR
jgi:hypothetical protein